MVSIMHINIERTDSLASARSTHASSSGHQAMNRPDRSIRVATRFQADLILSLTADCICLYPGII